MKYRAEIDGLRAVAVLSVVFYHAFPTVVRGGFIGVDIFFVISGYLISRIIFQGLDNRDFSFVDFYARRIRRIFPALLTVMILSLIFGAFILLADRYAMLGKHVARGSFFTVNFALVREAGYFDSAAVTKPMLHLWSLAVEEQFYIVWPFILWLLGRKRNLWFVVAVLISIISFIVNIRWASYGLMGARAFYLPEARFWELLIGALVSWLSLYKKDMIVSCRNIIDEYLTRYLPNTKGISKVNACMCVLGYALLVFGLIRINAKLHYPGEWGLVPVIGAVLLIAVGSGNWLNRKILMNPVSIWIGLVSYPLYLWHWPILTFLRIYVNDQPNAWLCWLAIFVSILLAWFTYRVIERPIRFGNFRRAKAIMLCVVMVVVGSVGYFVEIEQGFPQRHQLMAENDSDFKILNKILKGREVRDHSQPKEVVRDPRTGFVRLGTNDDFQVLIVGDSHSEQYESYFAKLLDAEPFGKPSLLFNAADFPPRFSDAPIEKDPSIRTVVLSYFWAYHYGSRKVQQQYRGSGFGRPTVHYRDVEDMVQFDRQIESFVRRLVEHGKKVFIVLDNPFGEEGSVYYMLERNGLHLKRKTDIRRSRDVMLERTEPVRTKLLAIAKRTGASVIDPMDYLCDRTECPVLSESGELLYGDYDHLSDYTRQNLVGYIGAVLKR